MRAMFSITRNRTYLAASRGVPPAHKKRAYSVISRVYHVLMLFASPRTRRRSRTIPQTTTTTCRQLESESSTDDAHVATWRLHTECGAPQKQRLPSRVPFIGWRDTHSLLACQAASERARCRQKPREEPRTHGTATALFFVPLFSHAIPVNTLRHPRQR